MPLVSILIKQRKKKEKRRKCKRNWTCLRSSQLADYQKANCEYRSAGIYKQNSQFAQNPGKANHNINLLIYIAHYMWDVSRGITPFALYYGPITSRQDGRTCVDLKPKPSLEPHAKYWTQKTRTDWSDRENSMCARTYYPWTTVSHVKECLIRALFRSQHYDKPELRPIWNRSLYPNLVSSTEHKHTGQRIS